MLQQKEFLELAQQGCKLKEVINMSKILSEEESKKAENIFDKDYYIVDCENFTYFARKVRVIGISGGGYNDEIKYITNLPHPFAANEHRSMYFNELTRFKTFKEAQEGARHLNENPKNKERRERWLQDVFSQSFLEFKHTIEENRINV
jgi:hypothetical protein